MAEHLLDLTEVSETIRIPVATLRFWRHKGIGPKSFTIGRRVFFRESDVQGWLDAQYEAGDRSA